MSSVYNINVTLYKDLDKYSCAVLCSEWVTILSLKSISCLRTVYYRLHFEGSPVPVLCFSRNIRPVAHEKVKSGVNERGKKKYDMLNKSVFMVQMDTP